MCQLQGQVLMAWQSYSFGKTYPALPRLRTQPAKDESDNSADPLGLAAGDHCNKLSSMALLNLTVYVVGELKVVG